MVTPPPASGGGGSGRTRSVGCIAQKLTFVRGSAFIIAQLFGSQQRTKSVLRRRLLNVETLLKKEKYVQKYSISILTN